MDRHKSVEFSKKWTVILSEQGTADIYEGLLGKIIISLPFEKKEIADLICRCFNAHDILLKQRDDLLKACKLTKKQLLTHGEWDDGCFYYAGSSALELEEPLKLLKAAIAKARPHQDPR